MKQYLLDTNICAFLFRGKYGVDDKLREVGLQNCHISIITYAELYYGCVTSNNFEHNFKLLKEFSDNIDIIGIDGSISTFAREKGRLKKEGTLIEDFDLLIAATAIDNNLTLVTENTKHMGRIKGLSLENWITR